MGIRDFLFGKVKTIDDSKLGLFKARIKNVNPSIGYVWVSEIRLSGQLRETIIILEGNSKGPFKKQLESAYKIIDSINDIATSILLKSNSLNLDETKMIEEWRKEFYLSAITPIDLVENTFEVEFETTNSKDNRYILCTWKDNVISDIDIK
jgi:hypothetical protein